MQTKIFLESLKKIDAPQTLKDIRENIEWSKIGELIKIQQRIQAMRDLINVLQRHNQQKKEAKLQKKQNQARELMSRNSSGNFAYLLKMSEKNNDPSGRKYSVFSEESSSLSGDFDQEMSAASESAYRNGRFQYPLCLSSIVLRLSDILLNPGIIDCIKVDYKADIIRLIQLCLQEQKCLIYKMPFFVLNFLTSSSLTNQYSRLDFLKMITKNGRVVNKAFNSKMFLVLLNMIDHERVKEGGQQSQNQDQIMEFLKTLFDYNPDCFNVSQTLILLTRICLVGFIAMHNRTELTLEVLQVFQYLLKYNKYSSTHNLKNLAIMALTIMVTKEGLTPMAWNIVRNLISIDPDRMVYEILEILMIGNNSLVTPRATMDTPHTLASSQSGSQNLPNSSVGKSTDVSDLQLSQQEGRQSVREQKIDNQVLDQPDITKELYIKCFNQKRDEFAMDLEEIENDIQSKHKSCLINNFEEIDANLSMDELICKMECPTFFVNTQQVNQIIDFDQRQHKIFRESKFGIMKERLERDRHEFIVSLEKHIDRVKRGAVYFLGMTLYGLDNVAECSYSISRILDVFRQVLTNTKNFKLINEIIQSIFTLLENQAQASKLTFEWDLILDIIETLFKYHSKIIISNKKLGEIDAIFKRAHELIILDQYKRDEVRVFKLYKEVRQKYMSSKIFRDLELQYQSDKLNTGDSVKLREQYAIPHPNLVLLSLYIDHVLHHEFQKLEGLIRNMFLNETNITVKMLVLEKLHDYYKQCQGDLVQRQEIEMLLILAFDQVFKNRLTSQAMIFIDENHHGPKTKQDKPKDNTSNQNIKIQLKAVDLLAYMAHKTDDLGRFERIAVMMHSILQTDGLWKHPSVIASTQEKQAVYSSLYQESNVLMKQSLYRMIQVFKLKCNTFESAKAVTVLELLLNTFMHDTLDKRETIFNEILRNFRINSSGDLCWITKDEPLLVGIQEFAKINHCLQCIPVDDEDLEQVEHSQKMAISLQRLFEAFNFQQALGNETILNFKLNNLRMMKTLLFDLFAAQDNLHQVRVLHDPQHRPVESCINLSQIIKELITHIEIEFNFDCSKIILEITDLVIGSQSLEKEECRLTKLLLSEQEMFDIVSRVIKSSCHTFYKFEQKREQNAHRSTVKAKLVYPFGETKPSEAGSFVASNRRSMYEKSGDSALMFMQKQAQLSKEQSKFYDSLSSNDAFDYIEVCQNSLHLLSNILHSGIQRLFEEERDEFQIRFDSHLLGQGSLGRPNDQRVNQSPVFKDIMETLLLVTQSDQSLNLMTFPVLKVIEAVTNLLKKRFCTERIVISLSQFLLFRLALPKIVVVPNDFATLYEKSSKSSSPSAFLKGLLMQNIKTIEPKTDITSYNDSPQSLQMLDRIISLQNDLFDISADIDTFEVLQNFLTKVQAQFLYWHDSLQTPDPVTSMQHHFTTNLVDLLNWTLNTQKGQMKRHLNFIPQYFLKATEFFLVNQSVIQITRAGGFESPTNKLLVHIRNSISNFEMMCQITNPQQSHDQSSVDQNKRFMKKIARGESKLNTSNGFIERAQIDHQVLLQVIHPLITTKMKRDGNLLHIPREQAEGCMKLCKALDERPPYNVHIVFVLSYYAEQETSYDFLSRLGSFQSLEMFSQYFVNQGPEVRNFLQAQTGVVHDNSLNDIFFFISDALVVKPQQVNYELLSQIKGLQVILLSSLYPLLTRAITHQSNLTLRQMRDFIRAQSASETPPLRLFQLNQRSYMASFALNACGHASSSEPTDQDIFTLISKQQTQEASEGESSVDQSFEAFWAASSKEAHPNQTFTVSQPRRAAVGISKQPDANQSVMIGAVQLQMQEKSFQGSLPQESFFLSKIPSQVATPSSAISKGLNQVKRSNSDLLDPPSGVLLYDSQVIQNEQVGQEVRRLILMQHTLYNVSAGQGQSNSSVPNCLVRQQMISSYLHSIKQLLLQA